MHNGVLLYTCILLFGVILSSQFVCFFCCCFDFALYYYYYYYCPPFFFHCCKESPFPHLYGSLILIFIFSISLLLGYDHAVILLLKTGYIYDFLQ